MITLENTPKDYKPYPELNFCSNKILGGGHIFSFNKILPLLIGQGRTPAIWIQAISKPNGEEFVPIIYNSQSVHPIASVENNIEKNETIIYVKKKKILHVKSISEEFAIVDFIDFHQIGFNIRGTDKNLALGGMQLSKNTFQNVSVAFGLG